MCEGQFWLMVERLWWLDTYLSRDTRGKRCMDDGRVIIGPAPAPKPPPVALRFPGQRR